MGDPFDNYKMWVRNPENDTPQALSDMRETMKIAVTYAEEYGVYMGVEPEEGTVVDYASKARQLLDDMASPWLKIIFDGANLIHKGEANRMQEVLKEAFDLLGNDIILIHGKDLAAKQDIDPLSPFAPFAAPGKGILDYDTIIEQFRAYDYKGGFLLHGFKNEQEFPDGIAFINQKLKK